MLLFLANKGPLVAAVNAFSSPYYRNEIIDKNCGEQTKKFNHVVQIVGYDLT
jgi:hypothetical protein